MKGISWKTVGILAFLYGRGYRQTLNVVWPRSGCEGTSTNDQIRTFVSGQPEQVRNELREALIATGLSPKEIEKQLGPSFAVESA